MQHTITDQEIDSWNLADSGERLYSTDAVIEAYLRGKKVGLDEQQKAIQKTFADNWKKTGAHTLALFEALSNLDIQPISAHMKVASLISFEIIVLLSEADFLGEKMGKVYMWCREFQNQVAEDSYRVRFNFIDALEDFDYSQLISDGFGAKYNPNPKKK